MNPIDPLQLQRLVDGELSAQQVRTVLTEAQLSPEQWEEIAVGFVENQLWNQAFLTQSTDASANGSQSNELKSLAVQVAEKTTNQKLNHGINEKVSGSKSWLVMAASLIAAAAIGFMLSQIQQRSLPQNSLAEVETPASSLTVPDTRDLIADNSRGNDLIEDTPQITQADYHLEVPPEKLGELGSAGPVPPVPLISVSNEKDLKNLNLFSQQQAQVVTPEMLKRLTGSGYQLKQDVDLISGRLEDGRAFFVPLRTIRFVSGQ
jgi:hypothetical protein